MGKKIIITGATGMVGQGVLLACIAHTVIDKVLVIGRSATPVRHAKLEEVLLKDFLHIDDVKDRLVGYDACFYCMGVSSLGMSEAMYTKITFTLAKAFVDVLFTLNPGIVFNYVSGAGTDSSEKGNTMWAKVKGRTENMIFRKGFGDAYAFRPGIILPEHGIRSKTIWYNALYTMARPLFPLFRRSKHVTTITRFSHAMINSICYPQPNKILHNIDINALGARD